MGYFYAYRNKIKFSTKTYIGLLVKKHTWLKDVLCIIVGLWFCIILHGSHNYISTSNYYVVYMTLLYSFLPLVFFKLSKRL